ncbi:MAG: GntR family transcriptional regulator [Pseudomonadota bacterium]
MESEATTKPAAAATRPAGVYEALRGDLARGRFAPGGRLAPKALAARYDCTPGVAREALIRLAAEGFVDSAAQRGFRAVRPTPASVWEIAHFRILIETEGARLSILHGDMAWEANLTGAHSRLTHMERRLRGRAPAGEDRRLWSAYDRAFHEALIEACGSTLLRARHHEIYDRFKQHVIAQDPTLGFRGEALVREHTDILDAALARDPVACAAALQRHFEIYRRFSDQPMR